MVVILTSLHICVPTVHWLVYEMGFLSPSVLSSFDSEHSHNRHQGDFSDAYMFSCLLVCFDFSSQNTCENDTIVHKKKKRKSNKLINKKFWPTHRYVHMLTHRDSSNFEQLFHFYHFTLICIQWLCVISLWIIEAPESGRKTQSNHYWYIDQSDKWFWSLLTCNSNGYPHASEYMLHPQVNAHPHLLSYFLVSDVYLLAFFSDLNHPPHPHLWNLNRFEWEKVCNKGNLYTQGWFYCILKCWILCQGL